MALVSISSVPPFVSPAEHSTIVSSTPSSFNDIPPVLRLKQENVRVSLNPPVPGLSISPDESGTLYVIDTVLVFLASSGHGFQLEYPSITLHAISRDPPSIYCQLISEVPLTETPNGAAETPQQNNAEDEDEETGGEIDEAMRELNIIPADSTALEPIFESLSYCASLHPDPPSSEYDDDDDEDQFADAGTNGFDTFEGSEQEELSAVGRVRSDFVNDNRYAPY
ncbi:hypothetical protein K435DRAFT_827348 [Dendrothele bispora CBS 962.96]|uniref:Regulator of volume decrease after cellular swelling-domain-containing protein n=1 Tax=Dendrothele bispora (strain CBS 962.96) TaxID=1314807 RepID=A0A4S8MJU2_DENBC|nr:hypothetical protein K435DRAFT_827348 [Dendrothele bispora CBS 962.96]